MKRTTLLAGSVLDGSILYVDSRLEEPVVAGPYQVITDPTR